MSAVIRWPDGREPGLRSPLADSIMLAAWAELERRGWRTIWGVFGYGSDGELTVDEIEGASGPGGGRRRFARHMVAHSRKSPPNWSKS